MLRRDFLAQAAIGIASDPYPGLQYRDYSRCWPDYLRSLAEVAARGRNLQLSQIKDRKDVIRRQEWARTTFWQLLGGQPERTPLNTRTIDGFSRDKYRVEKLVYESFPGVHISALLYVPTDRQPPFPAVLFQCGHSLNGKSADTYQRCCQGLARLGFLVLTLDPMGQGERTAYPKADGWLTRLGSADEEHSVPGRQMLLAGRTAARLQLWDTVRSLDVLAAHPLADRARIGVTGQSGGGTLSMFLAAVDDRPAAIAVSSGNTENIACIPFDPPGSTDDAEQNFPGSAPLGFDRWDTLYPFAPKPLLVLVSAKDFFGTYSPNYIRNGWEEFTKLRRIYSLLGAQDKLAWQDIPVPHSLGYEARLRVYNWLRRWLQPGEAAIEQEPSVLPESDKALWVSPQANVRKAFGGVTPFELNRLDADAVRTPDRPQGIEKLLRVERPAANSELKVLSRTRTSRGGSLEAIEVRSEGPVWLPAWLALGAPAEPQRACAVVIDPAGRNNLWQEGGLLESLVASGIAACAPDLRGIGDMRGEYQRGSVRNAVDHANEEAYAWASLVFGKPVLGQRVTDILALVAALKRHTALASSRIILAASGQLAIPALFAAHLDPAINALYLTSPLRSLRDLVETEEYHHPFSNFVPDILRFTDLPQLAKSLAPRPLLIAGAVSATGKPAPLDEVVQQYGGAGGHIRFLDKHLWSGSGFQSYMQSLASS